MTVYIYLEETEAWCPHVI